MLIVSVFVALLSMSTAGPSLQAVPVPTEAIVANDNRAAAGTRVGHVVHVSLDARWGRWFPDDNRQPAIPIQAFAEPGKPLLIPGPLIRVIAGTEVVLRLTNSIPGTVLTVHGMVDRPAYQDRPLSVSFGSARVVRFRARAPGTYAYWGTTSGRQKSDGVGWDSELSGAIVVDAAGSKPDVRNDRIFVIGNWMNVIDPNGVPAFRYELLTINGKAWPHTERLSYRQGTVVHWRWINTSGGPHPMHLHGFYFRVDSRGDGIADIDYRNADRDVEITELLPSGGTFAMTWSADRPGNWLIHCHIPGHQRAHLPIAEMLAGKPRLTVDEFQNAYLPHTEMGGLVLGIVVHPERAWRAPTQTPVRRLRLLVETSPENTPIKPAFRYVLVDGEKQFVGSGSVGPPIVLTQRVPVGIGIENRLSEPTAVHWHGLELTDSYYDGVAGFSGYGDRVAPMIAPGGRFEVQFAPPRAGTFIYHTHMHDVWQLRGGLAGPLIVLPPGSHFDTATDHIVMITAAALVADARNYVAINGERNPPALVISAGVTHRFRFINMTTIEPLAVISLAHVSTPVSWRPIAVDGADLPAQRRLPEPAVRTLTIGKTLDFEFTPTAPVELILVVRRGVAGPVLGTLPIRVI